MWSISEWCNIMLLWPQQHLGQQKRLSNYTERLSNCAMLLNLEWVLISYIDNPEVGNLWRFRIDLSMGSFCQQPREMGSPLTWKFGEVGPHLGLPLRMYGILGSHWTDLFELCYPDMQNEVLDLKFLKFISHVFINYISVTDNVDTLPQSLWISFITFVDPPAVTCSF